MEATLGSRKMAKAVAAEFLQGRLSPTLGS
jgi:hypothetical protein